MRLQLVNNIYRILNALVNKEINDGYNTLANPIPLAHRQSGLYFFLDPAIRRLNENGHKVVRVGISGNNGNNRLALHQSGTVSNSIFRKHVGRSLSNLNNEGIDEMQISGYLNNLVYLFLPVADEMQLKKMEKMFVGIFSNCGQLAPIDTPEGFWLGFQNGPHINNAISCSHLWNVHYVRSYDENNIQDYIATLQELNELVDAMP